VIPARRIGMPSSALTFLLSNSQRFREEGSTDTATGLTGGISLDGHVTPSIAERG
jgi:hypothetical protein